MIQSVKNKTMKIVEILTDKYGNVSGENTFVCFAFRYFLAIETETQKWVTFLTHGLLPASS